jgi:hypothetical protein
MFWQQAGPAERKMPNRQSINGAACRGMRGRHSVSWSQLYASDMESTVPVWFSDRPPSRRGSIGACLLNIRFAPLSSLLERLNGLLLKQEAVPMLEEMGAIKYFLRALLTLGALA